MMDHYVVISINGNVFHLTSVKYVTSEHNNEQPHINITYLSKLGQISPQMENNNSKHLFKKRILLKHGKNSCFVL